MRLFKWIVELTVTLKMFFRQRAEVTASVMGPQPLHGCGPTLENIHHFVQTE